MSVTVEEVRTAPDCVRLRSTWTCDCGCGTTSTQWAGGEPPKWVVVIGTKSRRSDPDSPMLHFVDLDHLMTWAGFPPDPGEEP